MSNAFHIATPKGPEEVSGFVWRFLGIHSEAPDRWAVTHIPSGHKVGVIGASFFTAKLILRELSSISDWGFTEMKAWKLADPSLPEKVLGFERECEEFWVASGKGGSQAVASEVARLNATPTP